MSESRTPIDRGVIFSGPMVRAILAGRKTQTRRLITSPLAKCLVGDRLWVRETWRVSSDCAEAWHPDTLTGWIDYQAKGTEERRAPDMEAVERAAFLKGEERDWDCLPQRWRPAIHMPRWTSRITLEISDVRRTETADQISREDAIAEGIYQPNGSGWTHDVDAPDWWNDPVFAFGKLWDGLHDKDGERFAEAPRVVALTFAARLANIDSPAT
jgi:hypothetical protein